MYPIPRDGNYMLVSFFVLPKRKVTVKIINYHLTL